MEVSFHLDVGVFTASTCGCFNAPIVSWNYEICHPDGSRGDNTLQKEWIFLEKCWKGFGNLSRSLDWIGARSFPMGVASWEDGSLRTICPWVDCAVGMLHWNNLPDRKSVV